MQMAEYERTSRKPKNSAAIHIGTRENIWGERTRNW